MNTEDLEDRFGTVAVRKGFITTNQVVKALKIQVMEHIEKREHRFIGSILLEQGLITNSQIDEVLKSLGKRPN